MAKKKKTQTVYTRPNIQQSAVLDTWYNPITNKFLSTSRSDSPPENCILWNKEIRNFDPDYFYPHILSERLEPPSKANRTPRPNFIPIPPPQPEPLYFTEKQLLYFEFAEIPEIDRLPKKRCKELYKFDFRCNDKRSMRRDLLSIKHFMGTGILNCIYKNKELPRVKMIHSSVVKMCWSYNVFLQGYKSKYYGGYRLEKLNFYKILFEKF
jgi:hypothetical protein